MLWLLLHRPLCSGCCCIGRPGEEGEAMRLVGPIVGAALVIVVFGVLVGRAAGL
ncbi:hypothetical protein M493_03752 [Geobacillus genomosp. 3]|uniref:Uncharacterized protein n=1 Tax=Geobacillus genomosp. 3 TaxID=1921421 RepID=V5LWZ4_GEOG3|nr:hypothetical protein M493_03752 [Geobacillus genomosp. 3]